MKRTYEIPRALDIARSTLSGQKVKPLGFCMNGSFPTVAGCSPGASVTQLSVSCSPTGTLPTYGNCNAGTNVASGCIAGASIATNNCAAGSIYL
jgi:hypothetical protein